MYQLKYKQDDSFNITIFVGEDKRMYHMFFVNCY